MEPGSRLCCPHSPQHQARGSAELRQVNLRLRVVVQRRGRLPGSRNGSNGRDDAESRIREGGGRAAGGYPVLMSKIAIHSPQEVVAVDRGRMREIARAVLEGEGIKEYEISLAFVDNATIHRLNKQYLDHDEPTDVLSFPYSASNAKKLEGELVLGVEVAREQASERGHDVHAELALYVIHGLLHLCGYDDKSPADEKAMRERERHYLKATGLPDLPI